MLILRPQLSKLRGSIFFSSSFFWQKTKKYSKNFQIFWFFECLWMFPIFGDFEIIFWVFLGIFVGFIFFFWICLKFLFYFFFPSYYGYYKKSLRLLLNTKNRKQKNHKMLFFWHEGQKKPFFQYFFFGFWGDFYGIYIFWGYFLEICWFKFFLKVTVVTTKSHWGYYWTPKIRNRKTIKISFCLASRAKRDLAEGQYPPQELEESPRSGLYLLAAAYTVKI